jgi:uncharacterized glyoxalase superfamily protein PhnB
MPTDNFAAMRQSIIDGAPDTAFALAQQALSAGAIAVTEMTNLLWGDRGGRVRDPLGNIWWLQTRVEQVDREEMAKRAEAAMKQRG